MTLPLPPGTRLLTDKDNEGIDMSPAGLDYVGLDQPLPPTPAQAEQLINSDPNAAALRDATGVAEPGPTMGEPITYPDGIPGNTTSAQDQSDAGIVGNFASQVMNPYVSLGGMPQATIQPAGEDFAPLGGNEGRQIFQDALVNKPKEAGDALKETADLESKFSDSRANVLGDLHDSQAREQAALEERRQQNLQVVQAKQAQLEQASQRYASDLADKGKWWHQPGNIFAAFAANLMNLGSDDPLTGYKIIQSAINTDFKRRQELADMDLGNQKSNLASYRQMAGDQELGDRQALMDSYKIASMELDRLAAQAAGPIAKAKAKGVQALMAADVAKQRMALYRAAAYVRPQVTTPQMLGAYRQEGVATNGNGYTQYGQPPGTTVQPGTKNPYATPSQGQPVGAVSSGQASSGASSGPAVSESQATSMASKPAADWKDDPRVQEAERRSPGSIAAMDDEFVSATKNLFAEIGADPTTVHAGMTQKELEARLPTRQQRVAYNKAITAFNKDQGEDYKGMAERAAPISERISGYSRLGQDISQFQEMAGRLGTTPDKLLDTKTEQIVGPGNMKTMREWMLTNGVDNPTEKQVQEQLRAVANLKQTIAYNIITFSKSQFGANVSPGEEKIRQQFMGTDHSFGSLSNMQKLIGGPAQAAMNNAIQGAKYNKSRIMWRIYGGNQPPKNSDFQGVPRRAEMDNNGAMINKNREHVQGVAKQGADKTDEERAIENLSKMGLKQGSDGRMR